MKSNLEKDFERGTYSGVNLKELGEAMMYQLRFFACGENRVESNLVCQGAFN